MSSVGELAGFPVRSQDLANLVVLILPSQTATAGREQVAGSIQQCSAWASQRRSGSEMGWEITGDHLRRWEVVRKALSLPSLGRPEEVRSLLIKHSLDRMRSLGRDEPLVFANAAMRLLKTIQVEVATVDVADPLGAEVTSAIRAIGARQTSECVQAIYRAHTYFQSMSSAAASFGKCLAGLLCLDDPTQIRTAEQTARQDSWIRVKEALRAASDFEEGWNGFNASPASGRSAFFAGLVIDQLAKRIRPPKLFVDDEGDIVFTWDTPRRSIFLTVEPFKLHLLVKYSGGRKVRRDDISYRGGALPTEVTRYLPRVHQEYSKSGLMRE